jgi:hypothetical protein
VFTEKDIKTAIDEKKKYVNDKIKDIFKWSQFISHLWEWLISKK